MDEKFGIEIIIESTRGQTRTIARCNTAMDARKVCTGLIRNYDDAHNSEVAALRIVDNGHLIDAYTR